MPELETTLETNNQAASNETASNEAASNVNIDENERQFWEALSKTLEEKYNDHKAFRVFLLESLFNDKTWTDEIGLLDEWARKFTVETWNELRQSMGLPPKSLDHDDILIDRDDLSIYIYNEYEGMHIDMVESTKWHDLFMEFLVKIGAATRKAVNAKQAIRLLDKVVALFEEVEHCKKL
jgi:hypothetical protein